MRKYSALVARPKRTKLAATMTLASTAAEICALVVSP
ncbi:hypothetical protein HNP71_000623 [Acidocella aromatica]|uniref:Uncharacterized protein n=1 Tax=Acidocella aromatica TaxID=1303579 RepID=A0A840VGR0_9PROT|nr:hypothetical protein [Acidocella aromatica]